MNAYSNVIPTRMRLFSKHFATSVLPERIVRRLTSIRSSSDLLPEGFTLFSNFFDIREQRLLLTAALRQLDATESKRIRRLQIDYRARNPVSDTAPVENLFLPDRCYTFHEVCSWSATLLFSTVQTFIPQRVTTTMSFGLTAKCASLPGRNPIFTA